MPQSDLVYPAILVSLNFWPDLEADGLMRRGGWGDNVGPDMLTLVITMHW